MPVCLHEFHCRTATPEGCFFHDSSVCDQYNCSPGHALTPFKKAVVSFLTERPKRIRVSNSMALIPLIRLVALCVALAFSVIVLGLSAALTSTTEKFLDGYFIFAALAIATSSLAMITLPVMILLEILRPGGFTSMIMVEVSWLFILSVLFLATGADGAQAASDTFTFSCGDYIPTVAAACRETSAIQAFSFLNWIILMAYSVFIFAFTIISANRKGTGVWKSSVAEAPFFAPAETSAVQMEATPTTIPASTSTGYPVGAGGTGPTSVQAGTVTV